MSLNRWKVLACTLTVGVGGLAVFATDPAPKSEAPKEPGPLPNLTVKPATPPGGTDTPAPVIPVKGEEIEITLPVPPAPVKADEPKKPGVEPVFEPIAPTPPAPIILPVKGEAEPKKDEVPPVAVPAAFPPVPAKPDTKEPPKVPEITIPDTPKAESSEPPVISLPTDTKKPAPVKIESPAKPVAPPGPEKKPEPPAVTTPPAPTISLPGPKPDVPPVVVTPAPPEPVKVPTTPAPARGAEPAKLKMLLRMGDGQPRFEIRNTATTDLLLKVYGEKVEMQAPPEARSTLAGVTATGHVRFTAPGIEGTCEHLRILSATGDVLLEGNIRVKTRHGKTWSELTADKMVYQIGTTGLTAPGAPKVTPAGYTQD